MEFPVEIREKILDSANKYSLSELKKAASELSDGYRGERNENIEFVNSEIKALVYAVTRMPATFGAVSRVFSYINEIVCESELARSVEIKSLLDIGAGTGSATLAALEAFDENPLDITCLEKNKYMRNLGEKLTGVKYLNTDILSYETDSKYDITVSSYVLNEISPKDLKNTVCKLWNMTGKILVIIEPGTPAGYDIIKKSREILLSENAHIIAPCTHESECKLPSDDWCHFTVRVNRSKLHKDLKEADAPYEDEKFSYMAFCKDEVSHKGARILRHPFIEKGKITLNLCTENGIKTETVTKKSPAFKEARKASCGERFFRN